MINKKRCPSGFKKNRLSGECESIVERKTSIKTRLSNNQKDKSTTKKATTKRQTQKKNTPKKNNTKKIKITSTKEASKKDISKEGSTKKITKTTKYTSKKDRSKKDQDNTNIYPNYDVDIVVLSDHKKSRLTKDLIESYYEFCRITPKEKQYAVGDIYFENSFKSSDHIFLTMPIKSEGDDIGKGGIAFVSSIDNGKGVTIKVLCAKRFGEKMMNEIILWAKKENFSYIKIESVWNAISFYRKLGFRFITKYTEKEDSYIKELSDKQSHKRFTKMSDYKNDVDFLMYLYELYKHGFCNKFKPPSLDHYTSKTSVATKCNNDAYDMILRL